MARIVRRGAFLGGAAALALAGTRRARAAASLDAPYQSVATIAVCGPFTGDESRLGEQIANGVRQACDDANRLHGTLDKVYQMQTFDDQNLLAEAIVSAGFAIDNPQVLCVVGHLGGQATEAAAKVYNNKGMPLIVPVSTFDRITGDGLTNVLRISVKDSSEGRLGAKYALDRYKPKKAVVFYQDGDYGYDVAVGFIQQAEADKIGTFDVQFAYDKPKFDLAAKKGLAAQPDLVYLAGNTADMGALVGSLRAQGYSGPLLASQGFYNTATFKALGSSGDGLVVSSPLPPLELAPSVFHIRSDYEQRYGAMSPLAAFGYAAAQVAVAAIHRTGATDRGALLRALTLPTNYDTLVGPRQFLPTGDQVDPNVFFYVARGGKWHYDRPAHPSSFILK